VEAHAATLWKRVTTNLSDPDMRAKVLALAGGKAIGLILLLTAMKIYLAPALFAQTPAPAGPSPEVNAINTAWTLIAAFLVFGMQVGFVMLEAGFARSRVSITPGGGIVDTCICGVTFWVSGLHVQGQQRFIGDGFSSRPRRNLRHHRRAMLVLGVPVRIRGHARRSLGAWSAAAVSSATSSLHRCHRVLSIRSSATGRGDERFLA
jgi:hypothetical protein